MFQKLKVRINGLSVFVVKSPGLDIDIITHFISRQGKKREVVQCCYCYDLNNITFIQK